jgi:hypothetical protein
MKADFFSNFVLVDLYRSKSLDVFIVYDTGGKGMGKKGGTHASSFQYVSIQRSAAIIYLLRGQSLVVRFVC